MSKTGLERSRNLFVTQLVLSLTYVSWRQVVSSNCRFLVDTKRQNGFKLSIESQLIENVIE